MTGTGFLVIANVLYLVVVGIVSYIKLDKFKQDHAHQLAKLNAKFETQELNQKQAKCKHHGAKHYEMVTKIPFLSNAPIIYWDKMCIVCGAHMGCITDLDKKIIDRDKLNVDIHQAQRVERMRQQAEY